MAALTAQLLVNAGTAPTPVAASASDTAPYGTGLDTWVEYANTDTNAKTVTVVVPGNNSYGQPNPDPVYALGANTGKLRIPLRREYDDGNSTGTATITVTGTGGVTGVTVAVVRAG